MQETVSTVFKILPGIAPSSTPSNQGTGWGSGEISNRSYLGVWRLDIDATGDTYRRLNPNDEGAKKPLSQEKLELGRTVRIEFTSTEFRWIEPGKEPDSAKCSVTSSNGNRLLIMVGNDKPASLEFAGPDRMTLLPLRPDGKYIPLCELFVLIRDTAAQPAAPASSASSDLGRPNADWQDWRAPEPLPTGMRRGTLKGVYVWRNPTDSSALQIEMVYVPPGPFLMGDEKHQQVISKGYYVARNDTTVAQYRAFITATPARSNAAIRAAGLSEERRPRWQSPGFVQGDDHPVVNVDWDDATAFCAWAGLRLPTEEEWEKAARGADGRKFPWGDDWDGSKCNHGVGQDADDSDGFKNTSPVGSLPTDISPYGALDMAGNVSQWTSTSVLDGDLIYRGGSWNSGAERCRSASRGEYGTVVRYDDLGFRPALSAR